MRGSVTVFYRCKRCKEAINIDAVVTLYISGKEVKRCPNCGAYGTLVKVARRRRRIMV